MDAAAGRDNGRVVRIDDARDPRLDDYRDLRDSALRRERGLFVAEGRLLVERLLPAPRFRTRSVLATPDAFGALAPLLDQAGAVAYVTAHEVIRDVVGFKFHRGVLALGERGEERALDALMSPAGRQTMLVIEDVRDPENVGGLFRNASAFGVDGVLLGPGSADALGRKALRVSAGAALAVPFAHATAWHEDLAQLRARGFTVVALTPDRSARDIAEVAARRSERLALLVGSEGDGLSAAARGLASVEARIPIAAGVDSLNVAVAAGIALDRLRRPRLQD
ncbi:MAG: RNA methyltransferase [Candidatus Rokubacteria bacterium]|nr:RNA methyltransferase [Candidatus Rokubacteria bacterium]